MNDVLLSIIIANYNYGRFLDSAIQSVVGQEGFSKCELIVVDGGSSDDSVEIIKRYSDKISWWISEKDKGQSDAFNKGFSHARGKYLTWLNADDIYVPGCLKHVTDELEKYPKTQWFTGNYFRFLESDKSIYEINWGPNFYPDWLQHPNSPVVSYGPSSFFAKRIYEQVGGIDEEMHMIMDTDLWLRFMARRIKQRRIRCFCWAFRMHESSKTAEYDGHFTGPSKQLKDERIRAAQKVKYKESTLLKLALYLWRLLDGSIIKLWFLRIILTAKTVKC